MPATTSKSFSPSSERLRHRDGDEHQGPLRADRHGVRRLPQAHRGHGRGPRRHFLSAPEKARQHAHALPRVLLRMAMSIFRLMDYFDWAPRTWLDVSPFHGGVTMLDLGGFGVPPADPHLADFGNMPCAVSFGARRKVNEADGTASGVERHYVDLRIACDERIADSYYFASALKCLKYFLRNPTFWTGSESVEGEDVN